MFCEKTVAIVDWRLPIVDLQVAMKLEELKAGKLEKIGNRKFGNE